MTPNLRPVRYERCDASVIEPSLRPSASILAFSAAIAGRPATMKPWPSELQVKFLGPEPEMCGLDRRTARSCCGPDLDVAADLFGIGHCPPVWRPARRDHIGDARSDRGEFSYRGEHADKFTAAVELAHRARFHQRCDQQTLAIAVRVRIGAAHDEGNRAAVGRDAERGIRDIMRARLADVGDRGEVAHAGRSAGLRRAGYRRQTRRRDPKQGEPAPRAPRTW